MSPLVEEENQKLDLNIFLTTCNSLGPVSFANRRVTAHRFVLIGKPDNQDDIEGCSGVVEKLRHYCFHACKV